VVTSAGILSVLRFNCACPPLVQRPGAKAGNVQSGYPSFGSTGVGKEWAVTLSFWGKSSENGCTLLHTAWDSGLINVFSSKSIFNLVVYLLYTYQNSEKNNLKTEVQ
jgi:hypothetical protein